MNKERKKGKKCCKIDIDRIVKCKNAVVNDQQNPSESPQMKEWNINENEDENGGWERNFSVNIHFCCFSFKGPQTMNFYAFCEEQGNESKCNISSINKKNWTRSIEFFSSFFCVIFCPIMNFWRFFSFLKTKEDFRIYTQIFIVSCKLHFWHFSN